MIDVARLRKELEFVTDHPEHWDQESWLRAATCGTVGCLAGNAVLHAGYEPHGALRTYGGATSYVRVPGDHPDALATGYADGRHIASVCDVARRLLGLDYQQASQLFYESNTLRTLWELAARFTDGEVEVPLDLEARVAAG